MTPYTIYPSTTVLLEPRYYGSIGWYAAMAAHEWCMVKYDNRHDKRHKLTHRTTIADVNGPLQLTMPLSHPLPGEVTGGITWRDMKISSHGEWWNVHRVALESAYGRTPFFEFYIDRFLPALTNGVVDRFETLQAIDTFIDTQIRHLLDLPDDVSEPVGDFVDISRREPEGITDAAPYYQVRRDKLGFIANLSILDLLFNLGPEAKLWIRKHLKNLTLTT